jgi:hypothetical protein
VTIKPFWIFHMPKWADITDVEHTQEDFFLEYVEELCIIALIEERTVQHTLKKKIDYIGAFVK